MGVINKKLEILEAYLKTYFHFFLESPQDQEHDLWQALYIYTQ